MRDEPLTADQFPQFFRLIHGCEPFPWQKRLTEQVLRDGHWPAVIDLPTGTGKTAVLDAAVFALAAKPEIFPRRVVFVIDRRIVVDQVCKRARHIAKALKVADAPLLESVGERLRALSDGGSALRVAALRGGIPIDNAWIRQPDEPWVLVSTVDQFGSRLLFRGYGAVSPRMRPIHAGLAGNDCLVILDEVHLSVPFAETLGQVGTFEPENGLPRRFAVVEMSATPSKADARRFQLNPVDDLEECAELRRRVRATKEARLISVQNHKVMPARIVKEVKSLTSSNTVPGTSSIGIVVNRVRTARETFTALNDAGYIAYLITGRMRPLDRIKALEDIAPVVEPGRHLGPGETTVVVATQAIEVGADFSFDALITECAAVDSLRQRFGRLDRRGIFSDRAGQAAPAVILGPRSVVAAKKPDPIYGESVKITWEELGNRVRDDRIDVGPLALDDFPEGATAPKDKAPLLLQTHMDAWVQTNPEPLVQPKVDWFLHGMESTVSPEVSIVWRKDTSPEVLQLVPPRQLEYMQIPLDAAKAWLRREDEADISDVPSSFAGAGDASDGSSVRRCIRWEGMGKDPTPVSSDDLRPGDVLVVETNEGGIRAGTWDPGCQEEVRDLGDDAQLAHRRRATLRLEVDLIFRLAPSSPSPPKPSDEIEAVNPRRTRIDEWLDQLRSQSEAPGLAEMATALEEGYEIASVGTANEAYYILSQRHVDAETMDGSDESNSRQGTDIPLRSHLEGVARRAGRFAEALRLPLELVEDLRLAGQLHDIGKVDRRFQAQLVGGDPVELALLEEPLAKSRPRTRRVRRYPTGMRHEVASLAMVQSNPAALGQAHDPELVLHLIGTHHGYGRSLLPVQEDLSPQLLRYTWREHVLTAETTNLVDTSLAPDMADRFWRLVRKYGYYGLAWLETILRLADHRESEAAS